MDRNEGIIASGGAYVVGSAVVSGDRAKAEIRDVAVNQSGGEQPSSAPDVRELLTELIAALGRSEHPDREGLIDVAQDVRTELDAAEPRKSKLQVLAGTLRSAVTGLTPLASLAVAIEQAIHGL